MADMARAEDNEMNDKNLEIVTEQLVMFEGEYEAVMAAKAQNQPQTPGNGNWAKADS